MRVTVFLEPFIPPFSGRFPFPRKNTKLPGPPLSAVHPLKNFKLAPHIKNFKLATPYSEENVENFAFLKYLDTE